jgi:hypothetical protein
MRHYFINWNYKAAMLPDQLILDWHFLLLETSLKAAFFIIADVQKKTKLGLPNFEGC